MTGKINYMLRFIMMWGALIDAFKKGDSVLQQQTLGNIHGEIGQNIAKKLFKYENEENLPASQVKDYCYKFYIDCLSNCLFYNQARKNRHNPFSFILNLAERYFKHGLHKEKI